MSTSTTGQPAPSNPGDLVDDVAGYAEALDHWLTQRPDLIASVHRPLPVYAERVEAMRAFMAELHAAGWSRYG